MSLRKDVPVTEICKAATWTSIHTFSKHYALVHASRADAVVGSAFLSSVFVPTPKLLPPSRDTAQESSRFFKMGLL